MIFLRLAVRLLCLCVLPLALCGCEQKPQTGPDHLEVSDSFEYAHSPRNSIDPKELLSGKNKLVFKSLELPENIGAYPQAIWLRGTIHLDAVEFDGDILAFPSYPLSKVDIWFVLDGGGIDHYQAGEWYPYQERAIKHEGIVFPLPENSGDSLQILVRILADTPVNFAAVLWNEEGWLKHSHDSRVWYGAFIGGMLALMIYNLFLAFTLRDSSYLYYVGYILSMVFTVLLQGGVSAEYFWPEGKSNTYVLMAYGIGMFMGIGFINHFLEIKSRSRWLYYGSTLISGYAAIAGSAIVWRIYLVPMSFPDETMHLVLGLGGIYYIGVSMISYLLGVKHARFLALSMSVLISTMVIYFMYFYGVIRYSPYVSHILEAGILAEAMLMSLALSDRIKMLADEKLALDRKYARIQNQFSQEIVDIEEDGKKRYASILHDSVGHGLLVLKQQLDSMMNNNPQAISRREIESMRYQCTEVMDEVRSLSHELHPHLLRNLGLKVALLSVLKRAFSSTDIAWNADIDAEIPTTSKNREMAVYRITQEAISNILKYAQAKKVHYSLHVDAHTIYVEIRDDGVGFDSTAISSGLGLKMMEAHVRLLAGKLDVNTELGEGTSIRFHIPRDSIHD